MKDKLEYKYPEACLDGAFCIQCNDCPDKPEKEESRRPVIKECKICDDSSSSESLPKEKLDETFAKEIVDMGKRLGIDKRKRPSGKLIDLIKPEIQTEKENKLLTHSQEIVTGDSTFSREVELHADICGSGLKRWTTDDICDKCVEIINHNRVRATDDKEYLGFLKIKWFKASDVEKMLDNDLEQWKSALDSLESIEIRSKESIRLYITSIFTDLKKLLGGEKG